MVRDMTRSSLIRLIFIVLLPLAVLPPMALAQTREDAIVNSATSVLDDIMRIPAQRIPTRLLGSAQGVAIVPGVVKGGFVIGVRHGRGVAVIRGQDGSWQPPAFVSMTGGSVGWQAGLQSTDVILVFRTRNSVTNLMSGKFTIGVDAAAAAGPVGRQAAAATDGRLKAEILSYSRSRGAFVGVSLDGSVLQIDHAAATAFYRTAGQSPVATIPASATNLINRLNFHSKPQAGAAAQALPTAQVQPQGQPTPQFQQATPQQLHPQVIQQPPVAGQVAATPVPAPGTFHPPAQPVPGQPIPGQVAQPGHVVPGAQAVPTAQGQLPAPTQTGPQPNVASRQLHAPPATVRPNEPAELVRRQLTRSWEQLSSLLDANWKTFLAPPEGVLKPGTYVDVEVLTSTLQRYSTVASKRRFAALAKRPEFVTTHQLLREYVTLMSASASRSLVLPPPPTEGSAINSSRY